MAEEGIPVHHGIGVNDARELELGAWPRMDGRGIFLNVYQSRRFVFDKPYQFTERYDAQDEYFKTVDKLEIDPVRGRAWLRAIVYAAGDLEFFVENRMQARRRTGPNDRDERDARLGPGGVALHRHAYLPRNPGCILSKKHGVAPSRR
ncbi:MAG: hypothetical protein EXR51_11015 [Dehalococcoidia bacterium]|nr:hypothetical protein [Dehalococcoidia bacterium]